MTEPNGPKHLGALTVNNFWTAQSVGVPNEAFQVYYKHVNKYAFKTKQPQPYFGRFYEL